MSNGRWRALEVRICFKSSVWIEWVHVLRQNEAVLQQSFGDDGCCELCTGEGLCNFISLQYCQTHRKCGVPMVGEGPWLPMPCGPKDVHVLEQWWHACPDSSARTR